MLFEQTPTDITVEPVTWNGYSLTAFRATPALSRETTAYSATLRKDGRKIGVISNSGNGGASRIDAVPSASRALEQEIVDTPSGIRLSDGIEPSADSVLELIADTARILSAKPRVVRFVVAKGRDADLSLGEVLYDPELMIHTIPMRGEGDVMVHRSIRQGMAVTGATEVYFGLRGRLYRMTKNEVR